MNLKKIALDAIAETTESPDPLNAEEIEETFGGYDESLEIGAEAEDAEPKNSAPKPKTPLEKHDAKYHPDGYEKGDKCKYRDDLKKGDAADMIDPENVEGEKVQRKKSMPVEQKLVGHVKQFHPDGKTMRKVVELFGKYPHPKLAAVKWGLKYDQVDILTDLWDYVNDRCYELSKLSKEDRHDALYNPPKGEIPVDRAAYNQWKVAHNQTSDKDKDVSGSIAYQPSFVLTGGSSGSSGGWVNQSSNSQYGQHFHSQGNKKYSNDLHKPTGLYKTTRPGGKALAREEDVPGMSAFNSKRPEFHEIGDVPDSLTKEQLKDFRYTANGSTYPMVGNVDGRNYIVKRGFEKNRKHYDLTDHIRKEVAADRFIRAAGLNAPVCKTFELDTGKSNIPKVDEADLKKYFDAEAAVRDAEAKREAVWNNDDATIRELKAADRAIEDRRQDVKDLEKSFGKKKDDLQDALKARTKDGKLVSRSDAGKELFKIAEYVDGGVSLVRSWYEGTKKEKEKIRRQVIDAYPIMSFLANIDAFKNDNVLVDKDSNLWFIDNGACWDYRAQGGKKLDKDGNPWFYERRNPYDWETGYFALLDNKDQKLLQDILADVDDRELFEAAKKYDFPKLVSTLPPDVAKPGLMEYAQLLQRAVHSPLPKGWID